MVQEAEVVKETAEEVENKDRFETHPIAYVAREHSNKLSDKSELQKQDITSIFYDTLNVILDKENLININVAGKVTSGKSTVGMAICNDVINMLINRGVRDKPMNIGDIYRDQHEFSKVMRSKKISNTCKVIDEWDAMQEGGINATAESRLLEHMSDVQAQRYVHKVSCSPQGKGDKNADIHLEVVEKNEHLEETLCYCYYSFMDGGQMIRQLLGYVRIDVSEVLDKDWYQTYRHKKFEKMDLMIESGVFNPRMLDYAPIIKDTIKELKNCVQVMTRRDAKALVHSTIKEMGTKHNVPLTILGLDDLKQDAWSALSIYKQVGKMESEIEKLKRKSKLTPHQKSELEQLKKARDQMSEQWQDELAKWANRAKLSEKYDDKDISGEDLKDEFEDYKL